MSDVLTKEQRRKNMQHIHNKDTKIEVILRKALWHEGIRYRKNYKKLPGTPDIAITKYKIAIFCDGEFFHGYNWDEQKPRILKGEHGQFWVDKIERNMERDRKKDQDLEMLGWTVLHFWGNNLGKFQV
jgi:DNA mismatch endonuclease (patch repair protein)